MVGGVFLKLNSLPLGWGFKVRMECGLQNHEYLRADDTDGVEKPLCWRPREQKREYQTGKRVQGRISTREHCQGVRSTRCIHSAPGEAVNNNLATCLGSTFDECQGLQASSAIDACQNVNPTLSIYQNARSYNHLRHHSTTTILRKGELFDKTRSGRASSRKVYQTSLIPARIRMQRSKSKRNGTRRADRQFIWCVLGIEVFDDITTTPHTAKTLRSDGLDLDINKSMSCPPILLVDIPLLFPTCFFSFHTRSAF